MVRIMSKRTGMMYGSYQDYIDQEIDPALTRIRRYGDKKGVDSSKVYDPVSLASYIKKVTGHVSSNQKDAMARTGEYDRLIEENQKRMRLRGPVEVRPRMIPVKTKRTYYSKLSRRELITRQAQLRREQDAIRRELKRRAKGKR